MLVDKQKHYLLGLILFAALLAFIWLSFLAGNGLPGSKKPYTLIFNSALGLTKDNAVMIAGVKIGHVKSIAVFGKKAKVEVLLNEDLKLFKNIQASIKSKTMLGEKYIALDPGDKSNPNLESGATIRDTLPNIEIDQLMRSGSALLSSIQQILLPIEKNIDQLDTMLKKADGKKISSSIAFTISEAGEFIHELNTLVKDNKGDIHSILADSKKQAPQLLSNLNQSSIHANRLLAQLSNSHISEAFSKIDPTLTQTQTMIASMNKTVKTFETLSEQLEKILFQIEHTLSRTEQITERSIRELLQEEGIKVNLIGNSKVQDRLRQLRNAPFPLPIP